MKNAIIIHGMPSYEEYSAVEGYEASRQQWLPWVKEQLVAKGIDAQTPEMPKPYEPVYEKWKEVFEQYMILPETMLIGHSCGGGFLVRWLSQNKVRVGKVVLVAPWTDPMKELSTGMFDFTIDPELVSRCESLTLFYSIDDGDDILKTVDELKASLPSAVFKEYDSKGHFTLEDMGTNEFPEILEVLGV